VWAAQQLAAHGSSSSRPTGPWTYLVECVWAEKDLGSAGREGPESVASARVPRPPLPVARHFVIVGGRGRGRRRSKVREMQGWRWGLMNGQLCTFSMQSMDKRPERRIETDSDAAVSFAACAALGFVVCPSTRRPGLEGDHAGDGTRQVEAGGGV